MYYYQHHIGDYRKDTAHLTLLEHGIYRQLLDLYYTNEQPLSLDHASNMRLVCVRTADESKAYENVLKDFFVKSEDGFHHKRCDDEILKFHGKSEKSRDAAHKRWANNANAMPTHSERNAREDANQEPITNNHKPKKEKATVVATPDGVSQSVWDDFKTLRKAKKAPITQRAVDGIIAEANKAGWSLEQALTECCVRGWQAFKAEWVADKPKLINRFDVAITTVPSKQERDPALVKLDEDRLRVVPPSPEVLAKFKSLRGVN